MSRKGHKGLLLVVAVVLGACSSGGGSATTSPGQGGASASSAASPSLAASSDAGSSASPAASTAASSAPSSGGGAAGACDLITASEAAGILDVESTTTESIPGEPSYCTYAGPDGTSILATSYGTAGGQAVFSVYEGEEGATAVSGIGDGAVFSPSTNTFFILTGDAIVGITAGPAGMEAADRLELSKQLGVIAAGRM